MRVPTWLGKYGKVKWKELVEQLGAFTPAQAHLLSLLCQSWESYFLALEDIRLNGSTQVIGVRRYANPACNVVNEERKSILRITKALGLSEELDSRPAKGTSPLQSMLEDE